MDIKRMLATHDYVGKSDDELTFKKGDAIQVPAAMLESKAEMIKGVFNGKVGSFPRIYVDDTSVKHKAGQATRVLALGAYEAKSDEELSFPKGARMFVAAKASPTHWKGVYNGKAGLIPVHMVVDASAKVDGADAAAKRPKCIAVRTYVTDDPANICFKLGQAVFVQDTDAAQAEWKGVCNDTVGLFPKEYVMDSTTVSEEEIKAAQAKAAATPEETAAAKKFDVVMAARKARLDAAGVKGE